MFSGRAVGVLCVQDALLVCCAEAVDALRELEAALQRETGVTSCDPHIAALLQRWHQLQTLARDKNLRLGHNRKTFTQFKVDLHAVELWLEGAERLQDTQQVTPTTLQHLHTAVASQKVRHASRYPPNRGYCFHFVCLSVRLSVCLSVRDALCGILCGYLLLGFSTHTDETYIT